MAPSHCNLCCMNRPIAPRGVACPVLSSRPLRPFQVSSLLRGVCDRWVVLDTCTKDISDGPLYKMYKKCTKNVHRSPRPPRRGTIRTHNDQRRTRLDGFFCAEAFAGKPSNDRHEPSAGPCSAKRSRESLLIWCPLFRVTSASINSPASATYSIAVSVPPVATVAARLHLVAHALLHGWSPWHASSHGFCTSSLNLLRKSGMRKCSCKLWMRRGGAAAAWLLLAAPSGGRTITASESATKLTARTSPK